MTILSLEKITYQANEETIIHPLSLTIEQNEFITISGPSGGGKSTLLKLIASLLTPTTGMIYFKNRPMSEYEITTYRQKVSYCFQQPALFGETVLDNLQFPFIVQDKAIDLALINQALTTVALPESYLDKKITELSGGEKQRVALLRNTLLMPDVLLLDEVTTGLDQKSKQIVQDYIEHLHGNGMTILKVTHDQEELDHAKQLIWIDKGVLKNESAIGK